MFRRFNRIIARVMIIPVAFLTTNEVKSFTYAPLSTFSLISSLFFGSLESKSINNNNKFHNNNNNIFNKRSLKNRI